MRRSGDLEMIAEIRSRAEPPPHGSDREVMHVKGEIRDIGEREDRDEIPIRGD